MINLIALKRYFKLTGDAKSIGEISRSLNIIVPDDNILSGHLLDAEKSLRKARERIKFVIGVVERDIEN
jgi:hypothetical protein